jgi:hypothetical protein
MLAPLLHFFSPRRQPLMTRQSYGHELITSATFPVAVAAIEGGAVAVLAEKAFNVSAFSFATIMASPMFANVTSFLWSRLGRGRRKVPFVSGLMFGLLTCVTLIALLPAPPAGEKPPLPIEAALVGLIVLGRCMLAGMTTLRSSVWRHNYSRAYRGRITGKLILLASMILAASPLIGGRLLNFYPELYHVIYPLAALVGLVGVLSFRRVRMRREGELMAHERAPRHARHAVGEAEAPGRPAGENFLTVLARDHNFRQYMLYQFIAGIGNMVCEVAFISFIIALTPPDDYFTAVLFNVTVPMALATASLPLWGRYLDRVHITHYRTRHGLTWVTAMLGYFGLGLAIVAHGASIWWLLLPRMIHGIGRGGGIIAWQLGHNDFADRRLVALYMGIHVTLTGIRGAVGPYLAVLLFWGWGQGPLFGRFGGPDIAGFDGIGVYLFLITALICIVALAGFYHMHRRIRREVSAVVD